MKILILVITLLVITLLVPYNAVADGLYCENGYQVIKDESKTTTLVNEYSERVLCNERLRKAEAHIERHTTSLKALLADIEVVE